MVTRGTRRRRRNPWRLFATRLVIALAATSLITTVSLAAARREADETLVNTPRVTFGDETLAPPELDDDPGEPTNFLIVGSDSRSDLQDQREAFGDVGGQRSDTIMVAHVDPIRRHAVVVSFPRDLVVDIPGHGTQKINGAFNQDAGGGPDLLVQTITENFGIEINHYIEVDFAGFPRVVDAIGRVDIYFPAPARDTYTGLFVGEGCQPLDGKTALQYVRSRHYQYFDWEEERYREDPSSDFGRIRRQQYFIRSLMDQALQRTSRQFWKARTLFDRTADMVAFDAGIDKEDLLKLIDSFINSDPAAIEMLTVPVRSNGSGGLLLRDDEAIPIFQKLLLDRPSLVDFGSFVIDVATATSSSGSSGTSGTSVTAAEVLADLDGLGFSAGETGTIDEAVPARTELRFATGRGRNAAAFVKLFIPDAVEVQVPALDGRGDLLVVVGTDYAGLEGVEAIATTTTIADASTTTATTIAPNPGKPHPDDEDALDGVPAVGCG